MKPFLFGVVAMAVLSACSSAPEPEPKVTQHIPQENNRFDESGGVSVVEYGAAGPLNHTLPADQQFQNASALMMQQKHAIAEMVRQSERVPSKNINHYVRALMHDLLGNLHYVNDDTPLGVSSFVFLDREFNHGTLLGNQIAESFVHEIHQVGIPVIDFKTTDYIRVTPQGDFVFSRDYMELKEMQPIKYVVAGTMVNHQGGVLINARIIGLTSKAVVASAQGFIPESICRGLLSSEKQDGIRLIQG